LKKKQGRGGQSTEKFVEGCGGIRSLICIRKGVPAEKKKRRGKRRAKGTKKPRVSTRSKGALRRGADSSDSRVIFGGDA